MNMLIIPMIAIFAIFSQVVSLFPGAPMEQAFLPIETVYINAIPLELWVATENDQQRLGLSGVRQTDMQLTYEVDGMAFLFDNPAIQYFWMRDMQFDLDVLWISEGEIVKIDEGIPFPSFESWEIAKMDSAPFEIDMVIELPAPSVSLLEIEVGDTLTE